MAINAYGQPYRKGIVNAIKPSKCLLEHIYWVTDMTYDQTTLSNDQEIKGAKITRSNIEKEGYLSFLLPLLEKTHSHW